MRKVKKINKKNVLRDVFNGLVLGFAVIGVLGTAAFGYTLVNRDYAPIPQYLVQAELNAVKNKYSSLLEEEKKSMDRQFEYSVAQLSFIMKGYANHLERSINFLRKRLRELDSALKSALREVDRRDKYIDQLEKKVKSNEKR